MRGRTRHPLSCAPVFTYFPALFFPLTFLIGVCRHVQTQQTHEHTVADTAGHKDRSRTDIQAHLYRPGTAAKAPARPFGALCRWKTLAHNCPLCPHTGTGRAEAHSPSQRLLQHREPRHAHTAGEPGDKPRGRIPAPRSPGPCGKRSGPPSRRISFMDHFEVFAGPPAGSEGLGRPQGKGPGSLSAAAAAPELASCFHLNGSLSPTCGAFPRQRASSSPRLDPMAGSRGRGNIDPVPPPSLHPRP